MRIFRGFWWPGVCLLCSIYKFWAKFEGFGVSRARTCPRAISRAPDWGIYSAWVSGNADERRVVMRSRICTPRVHLISICLSISVYVYKNTEINKRTLFVKQSYSIEFRQRLPNHRELRRSNIRSFTSEPNPVYDANSMRLSRKCQSGRSSLLLSVANFLLAKILVI